MFLKINILQEDTMFETDRCTIQKFQRIDWHDVSRLYMNIDVRKYLGGIRTEKQVQAALTHMLHPNDVCYNWVVREKKTHHFIGLVSLDTHHDGNDFELSYQFSPEWWGKGYATEVIHVIIEHAFKDLQLDKIVAETQVANRASCKLLEKIGMKRECDIMRFGEKQAIYYINNVILEV